MVGSQFVSQFGYAKWDNVVFEPGTLLARSYDANGLLVAIESISSTGRAVGVQLWVEDVSGTCLQFDGQDAVLVGIALIDAKGMTVTSADVQLNFTISGPAVIYGTGNGDPSDHTPDKCGVMSPWNAPCTRASFKGLSRLVVQGLYPHLNGK